MANRYLRIKGARVNNLKNIDLDIPRDKFVIFTGLSGSGKSSLACDTIYAEGHRRFVESLSSYARMFLGQLDKPDIDSVEGLSPAISIDQKTTSKNPRSTVGTVTEIYDYLRLLYARVGTPHCPVCGKEIVQQTIDQIIDQICTLLEGTKFLVLAPIVKSKKGMHEKVFEDARRAGYARVRVDGSLYELTEEITLDKNKKHTVEVVVDRLVMRPDIRSRLSDSVEAALHLADGNVLISIVNPTEGQAEEMAFSQSYACEEHNFSIGELAPRMFSFNNPIGACPHCAGLGEMHILNPDKLIPNKELSLADGAIAVNGFKSLADSTWSRPIFDALGQKFGFTLDTPLADYSPDAMNALLWGTGDELYHITRTFEGRVSNKPQTWEGLVAKINERMLYEKSDYYDQFVDDTPCPKCRGKRLNPAMLAVTVSGKSIDDFCSMSITNALDFANNMQLSEMQEAIAREILKEIRSRLGFLENVGLEYLTLSRRAGTLSGGEAQRIRLATQIGASLMGVLYILDEPSIGLHQRDNHKLIETLKHLRDVGNSVLVVEHDEETMLSADYIVDIGPGAGIHGGEVVAKGTPAEIMKNKHSITGDYLSGRKRIPVPALRRAGNGTKLRIVGAKENNLKNVTVDIPLGLFLCVTGVSGSGKSSLVNAILHRALARELNGATTYPGKHTRIEGIDALDKVIAIDQSPIGRTPRSNPATYTGLFTEIRSLFAQTVEAKKRAYGPGRFSFNVKGGRCEACEGDGVKCIEMHFLPDVYVTCDVCKGKRYNRDTLACTYKGKTISDVLDMSVEEGLSFFANLPRLANKLQTLYDVGLGYIKIGQSSTTLSGGEAQRVKLATELSRRATGRTVYILDEPTTGLHAADVAKLIEVLERLVDAGNSVIVIEHNLDMIKTADYIIDLGPEGGDGGGTVVATGTPEEVAQNPASHTGEYIRFMLERDARLAKEQSDNLEEHT